MGTNGGYRYCIFNNSNNSGWFMGYNVSSWGVINQRTQVGGAHLDFSKESLGFMCETLNKATNQRSMNMCPKAEEINTTTFSTCFHCRFSGNSKTIFHARYAAAKLAFAVGFMVDRKN